MPSRLVLASTSRYRRELLDRLRVPYDAVPHRIDEAAVSLTGSAAHAAQTLAIAKANSLAGDCGDALILASDQVVEIGGRFLGKPGTLQAAREQLRSLSGQPHRLVTAVALRSPDGAVAVETVIIELTMRVLAADEIERYLLADEPLDCAGSYKIESLGIALFDRIAGDDFTSIVGLPLTVVARLLRAAGYQVP